MEEDENTCAVKDIAEELVQLYALRQAKKRYVYDKDTVWQKEFEELFHTMKCSRIS